MRSLIAIALLTGFFIPIIIALFSLLYDLVARDCLSVSKIDSAGNDSVRQHSREIRP